ncbi:MAG: succinate dehydrogenase, hydrophobic membrane anchor protein [Hyphomicrobiaceae bacterium]|nr:succinate dehydrogenase, hydrophobic membrane anchor protein [Hyphomicrobiaceae bacterium]
MAMRTPLKDVRRLGSAKEGTDHFWRQRVTSVAALLLLPFALWIVLALVGADYDVVRRTLGNPVVAVLVLLFILTSIMHMRIGMQVIIEDYVQAEGAKIALLMLNTFFSVLVGLAGAFAVLRLSFGVAI